MPFFELSEAVKEMEAEKMTKTPLGAEWMQYLKPLQNGDAKQLIALVTSCYAEYADEGVVYDPDDLDSDLDAYDSYIKALGGEAFGIWIDGALRACAAYAMSSSDSPHCYEIKRFYMHKDSRGGGLAIAMLKHLEELVLAKGGKHMLLWSDTRFTRAHRFYEREGYRKTGSTRPLNDPSNTIEFCFAKTL